MDHVHPFFRYVKLPILVPRLSVIPRLSVASSRLNQSKRTWPWKLPCQSGALKGNVKKTSSWSIREKLDDQWLINHCQSARYQNNDNLLVNKSSDSRMFFQFAMFAGVTGGSYKHMKQWMCRLKNMKTMCILTISLYIFDYVYMHVRTYVIRR